MEGKNKKILIVEDDPIHAQLMRNELHFFDRSLIVDHVTTANQCIDCFNRNLKYDLIILNYDLPERDGFYLLRDLRGRFNFRYPIIMLFSPREQDLSKDALKSGADDYIIKTEDYTSRLIILIDEISKKVTPSVHEQVILEYRPKEDLIGFTLDDQKVFAQRGETILEVARRHNITIPSLCYHPSVTALGVCRICLVEITRGSRTRLDPSCVYPVQEGIVVKTRTERILRYRRMILELLMARCPDAELIKEMAKDMGLEKTRFYLRSDPDSCILCGLCVRVCEEKIGANAISFSERGIYRKISTPFLEFSDKCTGCGECAKVCPTEAITLKYIDQHFMKPSKKIRVAIKCDGCKGYKNRACLNNCPTGALSAMSIEEFLSKNKGYINVELRELLKYSLGEDEEGEGNA